MNERIYYIDCNSDEMVPHDLWTRIHLDKELVRVDERGRKLRTDLYNDPMYPALVRYVLENPPKVKA